MNLENVIKTVFPKADAKCIAEALEEFDIKNPIWFLAQCGHESANFTRFKENLNYSAEGLLKTFPKYFKTKELAEKCARQPEKIANVVYANRMGNGNSESGDGWKYRGRGAIQITGFNNYKSIENYLISYGICEYEGEITQNPELLEKCPFCIYSACAYWKINKLDSITDFKLLTKRINGGTIGLSERIRVKERLEALAKN
jgi:putative chitinase